MKAVLEGGGWEMSPPPSNKQPLEERNGAALFGGGGWHCPLTKQHKEQAIFERDARREPPDSPAC